MSGLSREERLRKTHKRMVEYGWQNTPLSWTSDVGFLLDALDAAEQRAEKAEARAERLAEALDLIKRGCELASDDLRPKLSRIHEVASAALAQHEGGEDADA